SAISDSTKYWLISSIEMSLLSSNGNSPSPPSSSVSYSLLSGSSEQDQPTRLENQRELLKALRELKTRVPAEWHRKGRSSTLASLQYALNCVKQVRANQEYYHQWSVEESHGCCLDLSSFTIEELDNVTSEYTLQNTDTFSVAVSFLSGKVVYISSQAASLLRCKPERLQGAVFSELLAPQDVSTFYSSTAPCHLPPWSSCAGTTSQADCTEEKSMFCRISRGRDSDGEVKYYPFRLTPYQLTLRDSDTSQPEPCCLLIAERVHSGYEAPRIPADKRIFTTSHTPNCLFQEIDERAVPLLGYLPQDLVGKPVLIYLHPEDRLLMVAIHKKILQFAGQPFDHSPLRMRAQSGEYLTLDTSWSSFINPWSRKVAFIVGRHKVRRSPLNEDVFTALEDGEVRTMSPDVPQLNERIHRVLVQPVHAGSSQGYGSLGSSGSHEHQQSANSSSESNGHASEDQIKPRKPMTFEQICQDMHMVKANGQQVFIDSRNRPPPEVTYTAEASAREGLASLALSSPPRKELPFVYSYQQINCLDNIIRYLESFNVPGTVKRKCGSSSCTTSSTSDDDKQREGTLVVTEGSKVVPAAPAHPLTPLALHCKAESVVSATSLCSFSSTIVHVGDKKPPESDIVMMEEPPTTPTPSTSAPPTSVTSPLSMNPQQAVSPTAVPEKEKEKERRGGGNTGKGLTKAVLSAHTQQEEQAFLSRFRDISHLQMVQPSGPPQHRHMSTPGAKGNIIVELFTVNESNQDAMSTSSDMLDLLLQEDSRSGTGSAASGSGSSGSGSFGSGSNGCSTSGSGTRSSNTSKYFGSIDSSENDHNHKPTSKDIGGEQFIKFVLQDPIWLLMANTDDKVMMTYQIPVKDRESVLKEDRDALKAVQKHQPHFTEEQKQELTQVHPWFQTGCLPKAINVTVSKRQSDQHKHLEVGHGGGGSDIVSEGEAGLQTAGQ
uniref:Period circadian clock 1a n=1 Tax=Cyprinus carpio TaxID=7962 RepID=A0A8C2GDG5_CYPCA